MLSENYLTVGGKRFHYLWLRDNCLCPQCSHPTSFQKIYNISDCTDLPKPLSVELGEQKLRLDWDEKPSHRSVFPLSWLMTHAYDRTAESGDFHCETEQGKDAKILWDKTSIEAYSPQSHVQFQKFYTEFQYFYRRTQNILKLDSQGQVVEINFGHSHGWNWDLPFDKMEQFYVAYLAFFRYLQNPDYQYCFRLQPGNCLLIHNSRILHGRKAFNANSGSRHLEVAYLVWDYLTGRHNFEQYKHLFPIDKMS